MAITTRSGKGSALTHTEMDTNFKQVPNGSDSSITDSAGNVGIGTTPRAENKLQLADNSGGFEFSIDNAVSNTCRIFAYDRVGGAYNDLQLRAENTTFLSQGVEKARISSNGLTFNGDTASANALDDYEEGTWTPGLAGETSGTASFASASGYYVKVGRIVTLYCYVNSTIDTTGLSGIILITGLPYNATTWMGNGTLTYADSLTNKNEQDITLTVVAYTSSRFRIYEGSSSGSISSSELNTGTLKFMLTATYRT